MALGSTAKLRMRFYKDTAGGQSMKSGDSQSCALDLHTDLTREKQSAVTAKACWHSLEYGVVIPSMALWLWPRILGNSEHYTTDRAYALLFRRQARSRGWGESPSMESVNQGLWNSMYQNTIHKVASAFFALKGSVIYLLSINQRQYFKSKSTVTNLLSQQGILGKTFADVL